ncbi:MAG: hypothetical protein Q4A54_14265, partial [Parabacteroides sp.]|nr:hypothetical protein [Parabacteroides sp.]
MRNRTKRIGIACLIPVVLILLISILLYIPPFQNFAVRFATQQISEATGMQIGIGKIHLSFPLNLNVQRVNVIQTTDTLLALDRFQINIRLLPLLKKKITVDAVSLQGVKVDSKDFIEGIVLKGSLGKLYAKADQINLKNETVQLNQINLSDTDLTLHLKDSTESDTTSTPTNWKITLDQIQLDRIALAMQMGSDSLHLSSYIHEAGLTKGFLDLGKEHYKVNQFFISNSSLTYDENNKSPIQGFDASHVALSDMQILIDSLLYEGKKMRGQIKTCSFHERSGLSVSSLIGGIVSDDSTLQIPQLELRTPYSQIHLQAHIPWSTLAENPQGNLVSELTASLGKEDLFTFIGELPEDFKQAYPNSSLNISSQIEGNLSSMALRVFKGELHEAFDFHLSGEIKAVTDSVHRSGKLQLNAQTGNMDFLLSLLPADQRARYRLP